MNDIMTPDHPKWEEFLKALFDKCNFTETRNPGQYEWICSSGELESEGLLVWSAEILKEIEGIDVEGSLAFLKEKGGTCDCNVLFNVDRGRLVNLLRKKFIV